MQQQDAKYSHHNFKLAYPGQWLFYLIASLGVFISLLLWHGLLVQANTHLQRIIQLQTEHVSQDIDTQLVLRISALKHLAKHLEKTNKISLKDWDDHLSIFYASFTGFQSVSLFDPNLSLRSLSPSKQKMISKQEYNEFIARFQNPIKDSITLKERIWISPVLNIAPAQKGIFIVIPLMTGSNTLQGYLISTMTLTQLFNIELNTTEFSLSIYDGEQLIFQFGSTKREKNIRTYTTFINLYGTDWKINAWPSQAYVDSLRSYLPLVALILGIFIALLFAIAFRLGQIARQRARSLRRINSDLKKEISERLHAEDTKRRLEKKLLQGQKLQAIGTLAGGIAHDFNNIIYAIIGYVEMAQEDVPAESITYKNLGKVLEGAKRGQDLVSRILTFSRRQHYEFKGIPLTQTLQGVLDLLRPTVPASVAINFVVTIPFESMVLANETQLHQVLMNLINNAIDAMDGEGSINIFISRLLAGDELFQQYPYIANNDYYRIDVSDTGYGMDDATIERIFEPFFTTKEVGRGTGLGLATVHAIIKEHQGEVLVQSQLGRGTTFTLLLPIYSGLMNTTETEDDG